MLLLLVVTNLVPRNLCDRSVKNNPIFFSFKKQKKITFHFFVIGIFYDINAHFVYCILDFSFILECFLSNSADMVKNLL